MFESTPFSINAWGAVPAGDRPSRHELLYLGLVLERIPAADFPAVALDLLEDDPGHPGLTELATEGRPSLEAHGELLTRYLRSRGMPAIEPLDAALAMSVLRARLALLPNAGFIGPACMEIAGYWQGIIGTRPIPDAIEVPEEVRMMWSVTETSRSRLWDRLGRYATDEEVERETQSELRILLRELIRLHGRARSPVGQ